MSTFSEDAAVYGGLRSTIDTNLKQVANGLATAKSALESAKSGLTAADATATDLSDSELTASLNKSAAQLVSYFTSSFGGISVLAQFIADLSEEAGLEGGANELRLYQDGSVVSVSQDA